MTHVNIRTNESSILFFRKKRGNNRTKLSYYKKVHFSNKGHFEINRAVAISQNKGHFEINRAVAISQQLFPEIKSNPECCNYSNGYF